MELICMIEDAESNKPTTTTPANQHPKTPHYNSKWDFCAIMGLFPKKATKGHKSLGYTRTSPSEECKDWQMKHTILTNIQSSWLCIYTHQAFQNLTYVNLYICHGIWCITISYIWCTTAHYGKIYIQNITSHEIWYYIHIMHTFRFYVTSHIKWCHVFPIKYKIIIIKL